MNSNYLLLALLVFTLFLRSNSSSDCNKWVVNFHCGTTCTGTPSCGLGVKCGNVDDMCYCNCVLGYSKAKCVTTELGYKWNKGIKLANGSYALNGTKGDGRHYDCR